MCTLSIASQRSACSIQTLSRSPSSPAAGLIQVELWKACVSPRGSSSFLSTLSEENRPAATVAKSAAAARGYVAFTVSFQQDWCVPAESLKR